MIQIELSHEQILALLSAIEFAKLGDAGEFDETRLTPLYEAQLTLENAAQFEDRALNLPDGHR